MKNYRGKELFRLNIRCYDTKEVICNGVTYRQILFDGTATGPVFHGQILPGGVDTQVIGPDGKGTLSARYMLEGMDALGNPCRMYIENAANTGEDRTHPKCYSDSEALSWLKDASLIGRMENNNDCFYIVISEILSQE